MQISQVEFSHLKFTRATLEDADNVASLYRRVYGSDYPCLELFTAQGMREFLEFSQSKAVTIIVRIKNKVIAAATCQLNGRIVYSRGFMVDPKWQGKINARRVFQHIMQLFRKHFLGIADLIYGEARTETSKIQDIVEEIGCHPVAILPRKDIFYGKRESEIISVWYYQNPQPGPFSLSQEASKIAEKVLQYPVPYLEGEFHFVTPKTSDYIAVEKRESNGDSCLFVKLPSGDELSAIICYKSMNSEKVKIHAQCISNFYNLLFAFLTEIRLRKIEYIEIYIDAREFLRQVVVEDLGFRPTGFLVQWFGPDAMNPHDYVVYTKHWCSILPDCPTKYTKQSEFLKSFVGLPNLDETCQRLVDSMNREQAIGNYI